MNVTELASCQQCGKLHRKQKLLQVREIWGTASLCKTCYQRYQRTRWGYW